MEIQEFITEAEHLRSHLLSQAKHYLGDADSAEDAAQETLVRLWLAKDRIPDATKMRNMASVVCKNVSLNICAMPNPASPSIGQNQLLGLGTPKTSWWNRRI